jgi:surface antigen
VTAAAVTSVIPIIILSAPLLMSVKTYAAPSGSSSSSRVKQAGSVRDKIVSYSVSSEKQSFWDLNDGDLDIPYSPTALEQAVKAMSSRRAEDLDRVQAFISSEKPGNDLVKPAKLTLTAQIVKGLNTMYEGKTPDGFDASHEVDDHGSAYEFSQCTWWAYLRRHQLGLPVGSHMGNGNMWADSARARGYWVDHDPHVGDIMVFRSGQLGSDPVYGHVAIVEDVVVVNGASYVITSESGSSFNGVPVSRVIGDVNAYSYVHF